MVAMIFISRVEDQLEHELRFVDKSPPRILNLFCP